MASPCFYWYCFFVFVPAPDPDCPLWMRRGAQVQADQGSRCLSGVKRSEFSETPPEPSTAGCPGAKRRGRSNQGRFFFCLLVVFA